MKPILTFAIVTSVAIGYYYMALKAFESARGR